MTAARILGFSLLAVGVLIILYSLYASFSIFTGAKEPPEIFAVPERAEADDRIAGGKEVLPNSAEEIQARLDGLLQEQLQQIFPKEVLYKTLNLFSWSAFVGLLIFAGSQIAGIGVKLIK